MTAIQEKAAQMWQAMDQNEKAGVRFGLFPFKRMFEAEKEGFDCRDLSIALMKQAQNDGGMRV